MYVKSKIEEDKTNMAINHFVLLEADLQLF